MVEKKKSTRVQLRYRRGKFHYRLCTFQQCIAVFMASLPKARKYMALAFRVSSKSAIAATISPKDIHACMNYRSRIMPNSWQKDDKGKRIVRG